MDDQLIAMVRAKLATRAQIDLPRGVDDKGVDVARMLLKEAATRNVIVPIGRTIRRVVGGAGNVGAEFAEGLGAGTAGQGLARRAAQGAVLAGGYAGGRSATNKGRQKIDEFRYRHGLY